MIPDASSQTSKLMCAYSSTGPMVYGICFCPVTRHEDLKSVGVADSKVLKEQDREKIFDIIQSKSDFIGWSLEVISPVCISTSMYKRLVNSICLHVTLV